MGLGVMGIFGASGSGKTSLLEAVAGLRHGVEGRIVAGSEVWLDSDDGIDRPPEDRQVGHVPQDGLLFPHLDVRGNLLAGARRARKLGLDPEALLHRITSMLELEPLLDRAVQNLSGGERQRVALGRALCSGPRLLLLDEPLAALDVPLRRRLLPYLRRLRAELTVPMLLVSHDPLEVMALCDTVMVLRQGRVAGRGDPRALLADPRILGPEEGEGAFENLLVGRLLRRERGTAVVELGPGVELVTGPGPEAIDCDVLVGIPANEILLALREPIGLSARNILSATVVEVRPAGEVRWVSASLGPGLPALTVEVTADTPAALGLEPGQELFLVIKATSCRFHGQDR